MFNFPYKTAQKMWNLMRLGLHEPQTRKYPVIKETAKTKRRIPRRPSQITLPPPEFKLRSQKTSKKTRRASEISQNSNIPKREQPRKQQEASECSPDRRLRPPPLPQSEKLGPNSQAAAASGRDAPMPRSRAPLRAQARVDHAARRAAGDPNAMPGLRSPARGGEGRRKLRTPT
jgi:hypothetical protein